MLLSLLSSTKEIQDKLQGVPKIRNYPGIPLNKQKKKNSMNSMSGSVFHFGPSKASQRALNDNFLGYPA